MFDKLGVLEAFNPNVTLNGSHFIPIGEFYNGSVVYLGAGQYRYNGGDVITLYAGTTLVQVADLLPGLQAPDAAVWDFVDARSAACLEWFAENVHIFELVDYVTDLRA